MVMRGSAGGTCIEGFENLTHGGYRNEGERATIGFESCMTLTYSLLGDTDVTSPIDMDLMGSSSYRTRQWN